MGWSTVRQWTNSFVTHFKGISSSSLRQQRFSLQLYLSNSLSPAPPLCLYLNSFACLHFISFRFFASFLLFFIFLLDPPYHYSNILPRRRARIPICSSYYALSPLYSFIPTIFQWGDNTNTHTNAILLVRSTFGFRFGFGLGFLFYVFNIWSVLCLIISASDAQVQHFRLASTKQNKKPTTRDQQIGGE